MYETTLPCYFSLTFRRLGVKHRDSRTAAWSQPAVMWVKSKTIASGFANWCVELLMSS